MRLLFLGLAAVVAIGLVAVGLMVTAVLLAVFLLRRLWAALLGRPAPQRPARAHWRFSSRPWPPRPTARSGEVIDAEVREISRSGEGG